MTCNCITSPREHLRHFVTVAINALDVHLKYIYIFTLYIITVYIYT